MPKALVIAPRSDDADAIRHSLGRTWSSEAVPDLAAAEKRLKAASFDVAILALGPNGGGVPEIAAALRASATRTPLVVVAFPSGNPFPDDALAFRSLDAGARGFVRKEEVASGGLRSAVELAMEPGARKGAAGAIAAGIGRDNPPAPSPARRGLRVLLVDDDEAVRRIVGRMLESRYSVAVASGGHEALGLLGPRPDFDVVLCDVAMGDMDGTELAEAIRKRHPALYPRIVLLSGGATSQEVQECIERSGLRVLAKPCSLAELCETVESLSAE